MLIPDLRSRSDALERIDREEVEGAELRRMCQELATINRFLGGHAASMRTLGPVLAAHPDPLTLLDVGTGGGDFLRAIRRRARRRKRSPRLVGLDLHVPTCREAARLVARTAGIRFLAGNAFALPFADRSVDVVHTGMMLHHIPPRDVPALLKEMMRVARVGILVNDLHRHALAYAGIRFLTRLFSRSPFIRHDAPLSVHRGFRREELEALGREAGFHSVRIRWCWAFRYLLWIPRSSSSGHV